MDSRVVMINKLGKWIKDNEYIVDLVIYRQTRIEKNAITDKTRYLWTCCCLEIKQAAEKDGIDFTQVPENIERRN
ncbi:MAG: hypothetical protein ACYDHW_04675 [Syntrophorhabdaceae bacterium]